MGAGRNATGYLGLCRVKLKKNKGSFVHVITCYGLKSTHKNLPGLLFVSVWIKKKGIHSLETQRYGKQLHIPMTVFDKALPWGFTLETVAFFKCFAYCLFSPTSRHLEHGTEPWLCEQLGVFLWEAALMLLSVAFFVLVEEQVLINRIIQFWFLPGLGSLWTFHPAALSAGNPQATVTHIALEGCTKPSGAGMEQPELPGAPPGRGFPCWAEGAAAEGVSGECSTLSWVSPTAGDAGWLSHALTVHIAGKMKECMDCPPQPWHESVSTRIWVSPSLCHGLPGQSKAVLYLLCLSHPSFLGFCSRKLKHCFFTSSF